MCLLSTGFRVRVPSEVPIKLNHIFYYSLILNKSMSSNYTSVKRFFKNRKNDIVYTMGGKCCVCGYNKCNRALDVHHLDGDEKDFGISTKLNRSWKAISEELKKCALVCSNCHREIHDGLIDSSNMKSTFDLKRSNEIDEKTRRHRKHESSTCSNCGKEITSGSKYCKSCFAVIRDSQSRSKYPDDKTLYNMLLNGKFLTVANTIGVSYHALQKHCRKCGIPDKAAYYIKERKTYQIDL